MELELCKYERHLDSIKKGKEEGILISPKGPSGSIKLVKK